MLSLFDTFSARRQENITKSAGGAVIPGQKSTVSIFVLGPSITDDNDKMAIALLFLSHSLDNEKQHAQRAGFLVSLLSMAYANPELYLTANGSNADVKYVIYMIEKDPGRQKYGGLIVKTREMVYEKTTDWMFGSDLDYDQDNMLQNGRGTANIEDLVHTFGYQSCLGALIIQVWIVLVKAITSISGLRKGFFTRLEAFRQDGTVKSSLVFSGEAVEQIGSIMRSQQSLVTLMVETLITMNTGRNDLTTIEKNIQIVGNYIRDAGLASFFNTIRYGVETRMAALTLSSLRPDINRLKALMELYLSKGPRAPFICILRDPIHGEFAPGNYPALWSYAMGVAVVQNKAMQQYVTGRSYLDIEMFQLGQAVARDAESQMSSTLEDELGVTQEAKQNLKKHIQRISNSDTTFQKPTGGSAIEMAIDEEAEQSEAPKDQDQSNEVPSSIIPYAWASEVDNRVQEESKARDSNIKAEQENIRDRLNRRLKEKRGRDESGSTDKVQNTNQAEIDDLLSAFGNN
ncbi:nucleoprotein [Respirovirus rupicaprae]|uniref:Nucleocapsid n=1 Tax=Respirovirus ChamoisRV/IT2014 TaxID=2730603 RepID=A0A6M3TXL3_9MONO|nr:nucleoprotein [Respirovirus ChamoisRV/IT2014]